MTTFEKVVDAPSRGGAVEPVVATMRRAMHPVLMPNGEGLVFQHFPTWRRRDPRGYWTNERGACRYDPALVAYVRHMLGHEEVA